MTILYRHRRNDTNEVFYIGIGKKNRPNQKQNRNEFWKNIANKHGYTVDILMENLPWKIACELEIDLIKYYGRIDMGTGTLANMTAGGNGMQQLSPKSREKISKKAKERLLDPTKHGMYGKHHTIASIEQNRLSNINNNRTGINSSTWKDYIFKSILDKLIQKKLTCRQIWKECNCGQKHLTKSLLYHYNMVDMYLIRTLFIIKKEDLEYYIPLLSCQKLYKKYNIGQRPFNKLLNFYFNTHKLIEIRKQLLK